MCIDIAHEAFAMNGIFGIILYFIRYEDLSHDEQEKNPCLIRIHPITIIHACSCRPARAVTITTTIITIPRRCRRSNVSIIIRESGVPFRRKRARYSMRWRKFRLLSPLPLWSSCRWRISAANAGGCRPFGWGWSWHTRCGGFPSGGAERIMRM